MDSIQVPQRSWNDLKAAQRLKVSLNPIRNWAETIRQTNEQKYQELHEKEGLIRPVPQLTFLMGDPTKYPSFETIKDYKVIACESVGKIDGYTDFFGDMNVRQLLANKLSTENWKLQADDIILTMGGSLALYYCVYSMCNKGDKILMSRPAFPLMQAYAQFLEVEVLSYDLELPDWQPNFNQIEQLLKTHNDIKFILVNSPSNPLGSILSPKSIIQLMQTCGKFNNLPIVSDEIYEYMTYPGQEFKFISEYSTQIPILSCSGLTKRCLVPGWRLGWLAFYGPPGVFDQIKRALRGLCNILLMPNTICQVAANQVYNASNEFIPRIMADMQDRYETLKNGLKDLEGISVGCASGAMYSTIILDCSKFQDIPTAADFATQLQIQENVLLFPGELFNGKNFLRIVVCADQNVIEVACKRLRAFVNRHKIQ